MRHRTAKTSELARRIACKLTRIAHLCDVTSYVLLTLFLVHSETACGQDVYFNVNKTRPVRLTVIENGHPRRRLDARNRIAAIRVATFCVANLHRIASQFCVQTLIPYVIH